MSPRAPSRPADVAAQLLAENLVHHFCAVGEGRPDLVAVDRLRGGRAVVPDEKSDFLYDDVVVGQD